MREDDLERNLRRPLNRHPAEAVRDEGDSSDSSIKPAIRPSLPGHRRHRTEERVAKIQETHVDTPHLPLQPNVIDIRPTRVHLPPKELKMHDRTVSLPSGVPGGNVTSDTEGALLREARHERQAQDRQNNAILTGNDIVSKPNELHSRRPPSRYDAPIGYLVSPPLQVSSSSTPLVKSRRESHVPLGVTHNPSVTAIRGQVSENLAPVENHKSSIRMQDHTPPGRPEFLRPPNSFGLPSTFEPEQYGSNKQTATHHSDLPSTFNTNAANQADVLSTHLKTDISLQVSSNQSPANHFRQASRNVTAVDSTPTTTPMYLEAKKTTQQVDGSSIPPGSYLSQMLPRSTTPKPESALQKVPLTQPSVDLFSPPPVVNYGVPAHPESNGTLGIARSTTQKAESSPHNVLLPYGSSERPSQSTEDLYRNPVITATATYMESRKMAAQHPEPPSFPSTSITPNFAGTRPTPPKVESSPQLSTPQFRYPGQLPSTTLHSISSAPRTYPEPKAISQLSDQPLTLPGTNVASNQAYAWATPPKPERSPLASIQPSTDYPNQVPRNDPEAIVPQLQLNSRRMNAQQSDSPSAFSITISAPNQTVARATPLKAENSLPKESPVLPTPEHHRPPQKNVAVAPTEAHILPEFNTDIISPRLNQGLESEQKLGRSLRETPGYIATDRQVNLSSERVRALVGKEEITRADRVLPINSSNDPDYRVLAEPNGEDMIQARHNHANNPPNVNMLGIEEIPGNKLWTTVKEAEESKESMSSQNRTSDQKTREHGNTVFNSDTRNKTGVSVSQPPTYTVPNSGSAYPTPVTPPSIGLPDGSMTIDNGVKLPSLAGRQGKKPYPNYSPNSIARGRSANQSGSGAGKHNLDSERQEDRASQPAQGSGLPSQVAFSASKSSIVAMEPDIRGAEDKVHAARVHPNFGTAPPQLAPGWSQMSIETQPHATPSMSKSSSTSPNHPSGEGLSRAPQPTHQGSFEVPKSFTTPKIVPIILNNSKPQDILALSSNIGQKDAHNQAAVFNSNLKSVQSSKEYSKPTSFPSTIPLDPQGAGIVAQSLQHDKAKDAENQVKPYSADPASSKLNHDSNPMPSQQVASSLHPSTSHPIQPPLIHHPKLAEILSSPPPIHRSMTPARVHDNAPGSAAAAPFPGVMDISRSSPSAPVHVLTSKAHGSPSDRVRTTPLVSRDAATPKHSPSRRQTLDPLLNEQTLSQPMPHSTPGPTSNLSAATTSLARFAAPVVSLSSDSRLPDVMPTSHGAPGSHRLQTRNLPSRVASNVVDTTSSYNDQKYTQAQAPIETAPKLRPPAIHEIHSVTNYHNPPGRKLSGTMQANSNDQTIHRNRPSGAGVPPPISTSSVYPQPDIAGSQTTFPTFSSTTALRHKQSASLPSNMPPHLSQSQTTHRVHQTPQISGRSISTNPYRSRELAASEETILMTPSSLAPSMLKPTVSRSSITPATISQQDSRKRGKMVDMFLPKKPQEPQPVYEVWHPPSSRAADRVKAPTSVENLTQTNPSTKVAASLSSSRVNVPPPISIPTAPQPIQRRKSPNSKVFTPFRYLTSKRNRSMSLLSLEAQDGTAPSTVVGSPTASMHSQAPIQPPPLRDPIKATQEWRNREEAEVLSRANYRRQRPGVVFDVKEEPSQDKQRPKRRTRTPRVTGDERRR